MLFQRMIKFLLKTTVFGVEEQVFFSMVCCEHPECLAIPYLIILFQFLS